MNTATLNQSDSQVPVACGVAATRPRAEPSNLGPHATGNLGGFPQPACSLHPREHVGFFIAFRQLAGKLLVCNVNTQNSLPTGRRTADCNGRPSGNAAGRRDVHPKARADAGTVRSSDAVSALGLRATRSLESRRAGQSQSGSLERLRRHPQRHAQAPSVGLKVSFGSARGSERRPEGAESGRSRTAAPPPRKEHQNCFRPGRRLNPQPDAS
jgi:hypothetical protein